MSDKGEKSCPLCAEEMDLTDQQLKPCKCGYQICVWCWNHLMEMAENADKEGRCPACRAPYDKEKIVGMAASCERLVAEINSERKQKSQKTKSKASEGRKHLSDIRVIQRNLVYIIGLPLDLADEDILQRREYFSQYGKVLKVSISRTATGAIQNSSNNSCCVYITYSKEEEAIRCIQSVHHFVLDGKSLRACFGTTKYCHAWLRNLPCSNPDCLYLHDFGSQDDSFSKDEIVSAFTRSSDQQIVGATNNLHRRSGNVLPPPADEYNNITVLSTAKPIPNIPSNNTGRGSYADKSIGSSTPLSGEISWVSSVSARLSPLTCLSVSEGIPDKKSDVSNSHQVLTSELVNPTSSSLNSKRTMITEKNFQLHPNDTLEPLGSMKKYTNRVLQKDGFNADAGAILDAASATVSSSEHLPCLSASDGFSRDSVHPIISTRYPQLTKLSSNLDLHKSGTSFADRDSNGLCTGLASLSFQSDLKDDLFRSTIPKSSISNSSLINLPEFQDSFAATKMDSSSKESVTLQNVLNYDDLQVKDSNFRLPRAPTSCSPCSMQNVSRSNCSSCQMGEVSTQGNLHAESRTSHVVSSGDVASNGLRDNSAILFQNFNNTSKFSNLISDVREYLGPCSSGLNNVASSMGESTIISNILSMDIDAWENPLASPDSLVKLLAGSDKEQGSLKTPSSRKVQQSTQSRFSFARQDDSLHQVSQLDHSFNNSMQMQDNSFASHDSWQNRSWMDKCQSISSPDNFLGSDNTCTSNFSTSSCSNLSVLKAPIATPPGFSVPKRAPPPGFSSRGGEERALDISAHHMSAQPTVNVGNTRDVEFMDPAILEVGKGVLATAHNTAGFDVQSTFSSQFSPFDYEVRSQMLVGQSKSTHQNLIFPSQFGSRSTTRGDRHGISQMHNEHLQAYNQFPFAGFAAQQFEHGNLSNGHWGSSNEGGSIGNLDFSEVLTNERLQFHKLAPNYDDLKFRMPSSDNLYNGGFQDVSIEWADQ